MMSNGTAQTIQTPYDVPTGNRTVVTTGNRYDVPMGTPYVATLFRTYINN